MHVFFVALLGGGILREVENARMSLERSRAATIAQTLSGRISHTIATYLAVADTVRVLLEEGGGEIKDFERIMSNLVTSSGIRNVALAPGGVITQIHPLQGNEEAVCHDILSDPSRAIETAITVQSRKLTLTGPYELRQGGTGWWAVFQFIWKLPTIPLPSGGLSASPLTLLNA